MLCNALQNYLANAKGLPFFYAAGDSEYSSVLNELKQQGVAVDRISDFCPKPDKYPDLDDVVDFFRTLDVDCKQNRHVLIGLGECLALRGSAFAEKELHRLKTTTLGTARVILLLRCVTAQVEAMGQEDGRLAAQQRIFINSNAFSSTSITCARYPMSADAKIGVKGLLKAFEEGAIGNCLVQTEMNFAASLLPVSCIRTAYAAIHCSFPNINLKEDLGTAAQWDCLFQELSKRENSMEAVFRKYGFTDEFEEELYTNCAGLEFRNWLFFIYLKQKCAHIENGYLRHVVSVTNCAEQLKDNILTEIINVSKTDRCFASFYAERKRLIKGFPESELAIFIHQNSIDPQESVYRFTDCTRLECEEIIKWIAMYGYVEEIDTLYPALGAYLKDYLFECGKLSDMLTDYFKQYRIQKVANFITPEFLKQVENNAQALPYTHLEKRDSAILRITDKNSAFLYWIDALGVEYLPYMTELARKKGLAIHAEITYSDLPTITALNKGFYEQWSGSLKAKEPTLDEIKHKEKGGFDFTKHDEPIHLVSELKIIEKAIDRAATELAMHTCKSFVIASDHGASRLAVIHRQEEKYETDTKGEHSGRCCKIFNGADLPYALPENGYLVLANYGRFKKSRSANVEVHGGASLEEVLVPIVTLTLRKQSDLTLKVLHADSIYADRHDGTQIELYISAVEHPDEVIVEIGDNHYQAVCKDATHFIVALSDMRRPKKNISASIRDEGDLIGNVLFESKSKTATVKNDFDDLF